MEQGGGDPRVQVTAGPTKLGVTLTLGEVQVALTPPAPAGLASLTPEQVRAPALRQARRALEVAREELD